MTISWTAANYGVAESWKLRGGLSGYQARAIDALVANRRGIVVSPAGSGKTIIAARAVEACIREARNRFDTGIVRKLLWTASTHELVKQARSALAILPKGISACIDARLGCWDSFVPADFEWAEYVVVDECDEAAAPTRAALLKHATGAIRLWGLTATDHREDGNWPIVVDLVGPVVERIEKEEVESGGHRVSGAVRIVTVNEPGELDEKVKALVFDKDNSGKSLFDKRWGAMQWGLKKRGGDFGAARRECEARVVMQEAMRLGIAENEARNAAAAAIARFHADAGKSVLVLVFSVDQGRSIANAVPGARLVFSKMRKKRDGDREAFVQEFRDGTAKVLVATSLADRGFDAPRASVLIRAGGGRGISKAEDGDGKKRVSSRLTQQAGRVLRTFEDKDFGTIFDFDDVQHRFLASQSKSRMKGYAAMGMTVERVSLASATGALIDDSADLFAQGERRVVA